MSTITTVRCASSCSTGRLAGTILDKRTASLFARPTGRLNHVLTNFDYAYSHGARLVGGRCEPNLSVTWCDHPRATLILLGERTLFAGDSSQRDELLARFLGDKIPGTVYIYHYKIYEAAHSGHWAEPPSRRLYI